MKNKNFYCLLLLVLFITVCSCGDNQKDFPDSIIFPSSGDTQPIFSSQGGTTTLSFTAAGDWVATLTNTRGNDWITIEPAFGNRGEAQMTIIVTSNETLDERSATIVVTCESNSKNIVITQKPKEIERDALIALYKSAGGDSWKNKTNWCSDRPVGEWYGITMSGTKVQSILLSRNGLKGTIPAEIGDLSELQILDLSKNNLEGAIPKTIGKLVKVEYLFLSGNRLSGSIPKEIGNMISLAEFNIANSTFSAEGGTIEIDPETGEVIGGGTAQNSISGEIPVELCKLPNLKMLYLDGNKLSGEIPEDIWSMPSLIYLGLSQNLLTGHIPSSIRNAKNLKQLLLSNNLLTGSLPDEICGLSNLEEFEIGNTTYKIVAGWMVKNTEYNNITGTIPENIGNLKKLRELYVGSIGLTGELPRSIWECESMEILDLGNGIGKYSNAFTGAISEKIVNLRNLYNITTTGNKFTGTIPKSITKLTNLGVFALNENNFEGTIPEDIGNLVNLRTFYVAYNNLSGTIPESICNLVKLQGFFISGNKIEGTIPEGIGNLKKLEVFWAHKNNLVGNLPIGLAELPALRNIVVNGNRLNGVVPKEIVQLPTWDTYNIEYDLLPQQEGYGLTIDYGKVGNKAQKTFINRNMQTISPSYQIGDQMVFETEDGRETVSIIRDR